MDCPASDVPWHLSVDAPTTPDAAYVPCNTSTSLPPVRRTQYTLLCGGQYARSGSPYDLPNRQANLNHTG